MTDLSQLIMEKLKFLSEGKNSVSPVQVMTIQIEVCIKIFQIITFVNRIHIILLSYFRL